MENQRKVIEILFRRIPLKQIVNGLNEINSFCNNTSYCTFKNIPEKTFLSSSYNIYRSLSNDEIRNIYYKTTTDMKSEYNNTVSVFNLLYKYGAKVLTTDDKYPVCRYEYILNWWKISNKIGQDLITTAYLAYRDIKNHEHTKCFSYPAVINNDNNRLNHILDKGLAENHFHLNGSSASFALSWIYLMNHFDLINKKTAAFDNLLDKDIYDIGEDFKWGKYIRIAAIIRTYLFSKIINKELDCKEFINNEINNLAYRNLFVSDLIQRLKYQYGKKIDNGCQTLDYALHYRLYKENFNENRALVGERYFLYECFRRVYLDSFNFEEQQMLYVYLVIKASFRGEMIQSNDRVGFNNFCQYQDRKDIIFENDRIYEKEADILAVNASYKSQNITLFEIRIASKNNTHKIIESINKKDCHVLDYKYDVLKDSVEYKNNYISDENYFYVVHFIKSGEKNHFTDNFVEGYIRCRNYDKRRDTHRGAIALYEALEKDNHLRKRIKGIDAAASEIGCRPEVMASEFRYLRNINPIDTIRCPFIVKNPLTINVTYHVGEDFLDIIDGLRAIDEAILFLNLKRNDRLGHALAMGTDTLCYYEKRNFTTVLSKQDLLDNLTWFIYKADALNVNIQSSDRQKIMCKINILFNEIFFQNSFREKHSFNFEDYINSWKLRGDLPDLYRYGKYKNEATSYLTAFADASTNNLVDDTIRLNPISAQLYSEYHFNGKVRKSGKQQDSFELSRTMITSLSEVQIGMQFEISALGISIECNPTSNYVIGSFKRFDKHPIIKFHNNGLELNEENLKKCPQISVSINTDDQGVFDTNLKNEYAVMTAALEQIKDKNGQFKYSPNQVYHWIDEIREMGIEQSFGTSLNQY